MDCLCKARARASPEGPAPIIATVSIRGMTAQRQWYAESHSYGVRYLVMRRNLRLRKTEQNKSFRLTHQDGLPCMLFAGGTVGVVTS